MIATFLLSAGTCHAQSAQMANPAPGSELTSSTVTFSWSTGTNVSNYYLGVGTSAASVANSPWGNIFAGPVTGTSQTISNIPITGGTVYVRLWSKINNVWNYNDYTYSTSFAGAEITSPVPGSELTSTNATFSWSAGTNVSGYYLGVGTSAASVANSPWGNIFAGAVTGTSQAVANIPITGGIIYVRLWSRINNVWTYKDHTFTTASNAAQITGPVPNSEISTPSVTFSWSTGTNVSSYYLGVGTSASSISITPWGDIFAGAVSGTSHTVSGIPLTGGKVHVRLWSKINNIWSFRDYTYTTTKVQPALAEMTSPQPDSTLTASPVTFTWTTGALATEYWLYVGTGGIGSANIFNQSLGLQTSTIVDNIPLTGAPVYVRLYTKISGSWGRIDYQYQTQEPNVAPQAFDQNLGVRINTSKTITLTADDANNDSLTYTIVDPPAHGSLTGTPPNVSYQPNTDFRGSDSFTFKANDGEFDSNIATISLNVSPETFGIYFDSPDVTPESQVIWDTDIALDIWNGLTIEELSGSAGEGQLSWTLTGTGDWIGMGLRVTGTSSTRDFSRFTGGYLHFYFRGTHPFKVGLKSGASTEAWINSTDLLQYGLTLDGTWSSVNVPLSAFSGVDLSNISQYFMFASDSDLGYEIGDTHHLDGIFYSTAPWEHPQRPPTAKNRSVTTQANTPVDILLAGTDPDGDTLTFQITVLPENGTITGTPPDVTYTPDTDFFGSDFFRFTVHDGFTASFPGTVSIDILEPPQVFTPVWSIPDRSGTSARVFNFDYASGITSDEQDRIYVIDQNKIQIFDSDGYYDSEWIPDSSSVSFNYTKNIATDRQGHIYVSDPFLNRIVKYDYAGNFISYFNMPDPQGIALGPDGHLYVLDNSNHQLHKCDLNGNVLASYGDAGQFSYPSDVAVDAGGNMFIADTNHMQIQKLDPDGNVLLTWSTPGVVRSIDLDSTGNVYAIVDSGNSSLIKYSASGALISTLADDLDSAHHLHINDRNDIFIASSDQNDNSRVSVYNTGGTQTDAWENNSPFINPFIVGVDGDRLCVIDDGKYKMYDLSGNFIEEVNWPFSADNPSMDRAGTLYTGTTVAISSNLGGHVQTSIEKHTFDRSAKTFTTTNMGSWSCSISIGGTSDCNSIARVTAYAGMIDGVRSFILDPGPPAGDGGGVRRVVGGVLESQPGSWADRPHDIVIDEINRRVFVSSEGRLYKRTSGGGSDDWWGVSNFDVTELAVDNLSHVYMTIPDGNRVVKFDGLRTFTDIGEPGVLNGQFRKPSSIAVDNNLCIYVADTVNNSIHKMCP